MSELQIPLILPVAILAAWGILVLLMAPFFRETGRGWAAMVSPWSVSLLGIIFAAWASVMQWRGIGLSTATTAYGMVRVDRFGIYISLLVLVVGFLTLLFSARFLEREGAEHGEFFALMLFALAGMVLMLETTNLMLLLIGLEIFSLTLYVLCGLTRGRVRSIESALKYFLLGAFSSGFLVYGLALIYGGAHTLDLAAIAQAIAIRPSPMITMGLGLLIVGLGFKIAIVPFHQWVPDVYTGAPTNVPAFMAAAVGGGDAAAESGYDYITSWAGLGLRRPLLAGAMTLFLLSMAGIPPTGGFMGKYLIFQAAVQSKQWMLAIVGSLNAVIAAYYYLSVIMTMWFRQPDDEVASPLPVPPALAVVLTVAAVVVIYLGVAPTRVLGLINGFASTLI